MLVPSMFFPFERDHLKFRTNSQVWSRHWPIMKIPGQENVVWGVLLYGRQTEIWIRSRHRAGALLHLFSFSPVLCVSTRRNLNKVSTSGMSSPAVAIVTVWTETQGGYAAAAGENFHIVPQFHQNMLPMVSQACWSTKAQSAWAQWFWWFPLNSAAL